MPEPLRLHPAGRFPSPVQAVTALVALSLLTVGCADVERDPVSPSTTEVDAAVASNTLVTSLLAQDGRRRGIETEYLEIERDVPGFGGLYLDENLDIVAYLTDLSRTEALISAIQDRFLTDPYRFFRSYGSRPSVQVVKGEYDGRARVVADGVDTLVA